MTRVVNTPARDLIIEFEGCRLNKYTDSAGYSTIGIGHKIGDTEDIPDTISQEQCNQLFEGDIANAALLVEQFIRVVLTDNQFGALVSLAFNLGSGPFTHTLGTMLNAGDYVGAAEQFGRWRIAGGIVSDGLVRRRAAEKALFLVQNV